MTDVKTKIAETNVSLKAFLSLVTTIGFVMVSFWDELPTSFKYILVILIIIEVVAPFLGIKKIDAKEAFIMVLDSIQKAKAANPNGDFKLLDTIEAGILFLVQFWDKVNNLFKNDKKEAPKS